jgi:hypothetical protein
VGLLVVPWAPGPLLRIEAGRPGTELRRPRGLPIDPSDPDVAALVDAYEAVLAAVPEDEPTVTAAHFALLETASLLRWAPPAGPAEREYVRRRTRALGDLFREHPEEPIAFLRRAMRGDGG